MRSMEDVVKTLQKKELQLAKEKKSSFKEKGVASDLYVFLREQHNVVLDLMRELEIECLRPDEEEKEKEHREELNKEIEEKTSLRMKMKL